MANHEITIDNIHLSDRARRNISNELQQLADQTTVAISHVELTPSAKHNLQQELDTLTAGISIAPITVQVELDAQGTSPTNTLNSVGTTMMSLNALNTLTEIFSKSDTGMRLCPPCQRTPTRRNGGKSPFQGGEPVKCWKAPISSPVPKQSGKPQMAAA